jgi:predicted DNA-binding protein
VGKTKRHQQAIYLDHDKAALLDKLSEKTRVPKQGYLREAVDLLLRKYKLLKPKRKP